MLKNQKKKQIFYEVNPLFFFDSNNDGFGDFAGLSKKIDYFLFMGITCVIIPDIFNNYNNLLLNETINFVSKYGNIDNLIQLINTFEKSNIDFAVEINLRDIQKSLLFSSDNYSQKNINFRESKKTFFLDKNQNNQIDGNWNSAKTMNAFKKVVNFWLDLNVKNIAFVNFEYLYNNDQPFDKLLIDQMKNLYKIVNSIIPNVTIIMKSALLTQNHIDICLKEEDPCADFFINNSYSLAGTNLKNKNDKFEEFKPRQLFSKIKESFIHKNCNVKITMSLGSNLSGRINSRWGNEGEFNSYASKALLTVSLASPNSTCIYYGDELGTLKINIKNDEDFNDIYAIERRRLLQSQGQSKEDFLKAQQYLSPINTQSLFQWDSSKNGGFSKAHVVFRQISSTYKKINVATQYEDEQSSLIYVKKLIEFIMNSVYSNFFNKSETVVKLVSNDVIKYIYKYSSEKLFVFINLSSKWKKINISIKLNVVFSNYSEKQYNKKIKMLAPYEAIILFSEKQ